MNKTEKFYNKSEVVKMIDAEEVINKIKDDKYYTHEELTVVLNYIDKLKEEKEKFKKALGKRITYCNELEKDLFENCSNYVISKAKIREILNEISDEYLEKAQKSYRECYTFPEYWAIKIIKEKLLKE